MPPGPEPEGWLLRWPGGMTRAGGKPLAWGNATAVSERGVRGTPVTAEMPSMEVHDDRRIRSESGCPRDRSGPRFRGHDQPVSARLQHKDRGGDSHDCGS